MSKSPLLPILALVVTIAACHPKPTNGNKTSSLDSLKKSLLSKYDAESKGKFKYEGHIPDHNDTLRFDSLRSVFIDNNLESLEANCQFRNYGDAQSSQDLKNEYSKFANTYHAIHKWKIKKLYGPLSNLQKQIFPLFRSEFAGILNKKLWIDNGKARIWINNQRLQIISADFASNKNVLQSYKILKPVLAKYRFKQVDFLWYEGDDDYQSFTVPSNPDMWGL